MKDKKSKLKSRITNFIFFGLLFVLLVSTSAKSFLLRVVLSTGLFSPKIEKAEAETKQAAMPLTFQHADGKMESTENLRGKVVFINFWASWCPPCRAEMPSMEKMYNKMKSDEGIAFIFINLDDDNTAGINYLKEKNYSIPFQKAQGFIPTDLFTGTLPTTVVLDKQGAVVMNHSGMADYNSEKFIRQLTGLK